MMHEVMVEGAVTELYPPAYDHAFFALLLLAVTLTVVALVRLWRSTDNGPMSLLAFIAILALPIVGAGAYLYLTRHGRPLERRPAMNR
jgi:hypothetical protein